MANMTAQFPDVATARRVAEALVRDHGVQPQMIRLEPTGETPGYEAILPTGPLVTHEAAPAPVGATRLSVFDSAANPDDVRRALAEAGAADIRPMSH